MNNFVFEITSVFYFISVIFSNLRDINKMGS